jgi:hypothetical protein
MEQDGLLFQNKYIMEKLELSVKAIEGAEAFFIPSKLSLSLEPSLSTKITTVRFQLQDDRLPADYLTNGTVFREIKGTVEVSNDVAGSIYNTDGSINKDVLNAILKGFQVVAIDEQGAGGITIEN